MLDDLRKRKRNKKIKEQVEYQGSESNKKQFLGMTSSQRFLVALFLFIITLILGCSCLWIFGKIQLPFV